MSHPRITWPSHLRLWSLKTPNLQPSNAVVTERSRDVNWTNAEVNRPNDHIL